MYVLTEYTIAHPKLSAIKNVLQLHFNNTEQDFPRFQIASQRPPALCILLFKILPSFCPFTQKSLEWERCNKTADCSAEQHQP